jgi:hypothetical protein
MALEQIRYWWRMRRLERLVSRHAKWTADVITLLYRTNPTLASVTYARAKAIVRGDDSDEKITWLVARTRLIATADLLYSAVDQEIARLERADDA